MRRPDPNEPWSISENIWKRLSGLLAEFQKKNDYTSKEMAEMLDVNINTFYKYKRYSPDWRADSMLNVMRLIGVDMEGLTRGTQYEEVQ